MSASDPAVFLSYASQDAEAAKRIAESLRAAGIEVWFDQNELVGGDAWDAKIRQQIAECALFVPVISANTQARREGYFRLEWKLAAQRTHMIADGTPFLLPVVIDATRDAEAKVPAEFKAVQWTRLPGGETPEKFTAQVKKLLGGEVAENRGQRTEDRSGRTEPPPNWLRYGWAAVGIVFALVYTVRSLRQEKPRPEPQTPVVAPASEAQRLAGQARDQLNLGHRGLASLEAASLLAEQAIGLEPTNPEILAIASQVDIRMHFHSLDPSEKRLELARTRAARANQIAPGSFEARLAQATYLVYRPGGPQSEANGALLGELRTENPRDARVLLVRAAQLMEEGRHEESFAEYEEMARLPGLLPTALMSKAWDYHRLRRIPEMDAALERSISARPMAGAVALRVHYDLAWLGDLDAALANMQRLPPEELAEDNGISLAVRVHRWRRDPESLLRFLRAVPRNWIKWSVAGPKAALTGEAHAALGRMVAARTDWQQALALVEQRLAEYPSDRANLEWKAWLQASLGLVEAARETYAFLRELPEPNRWTLEFERMPRIAPAEDVLADLERRVDQTIAALDRKKRVPGNFISAAYLRLNPAWDPLRSHPRFVALQARLDANPRFNPNVRRMASTTDKADDKSVAVLAFTNLSDDKANEYFSDGISEELLNVLAKIPGLKVSARTSAFYFKGKEVPIPEIAKQLGVAYVVEGSVRKAGDKVRITAQLIKAADGFHVWSDTFTRDLKDIFAVQDEIAGLIARQLQLKLAEGGDRGTVDPALYELLLQARSLTLRESNEDWRQAISLYRRALEREPRLALAWAELARTYVQLGRFGGMPIQDAMREARAAAQRALDLVPDQATGLVALGWVQRTADWDWRAARQSFQRALELAPGNASIMGDLAVFYFNTGRVAEATTLARQAVERDPLNARAQASLGFILNLNGDWEQALPPLRQAVALAPAIEEVRSHQARALMALGQVSEAVAVAEQEPNEAYRLIARAFIPGSAADAALAEFVAKYGEEMPGYVANLHGIRGEIDPAFAWFERALARRDAAVVWVKTNINNRSLRADPRWPVFLRKVGLADDQLK